MSERLISASDGERTSKGLFEALFSDKVFGEFLRSGSALFHGPLNGFLIAADGLALGGIFKTALLDIEKDLNLPGLEGVPVHITAQQILD